MHYKSDSMTYKHSRPGGIAGEPGHSAKTAKGRRKMSRAGMTPAERLHEQSESAAYERVENPREEGES